MPLVDTHCHLQDEQFADSIDAVLERAWQANVQTILAVGTTAANSEACIALAARYPSVFASVGIHPNHCNEVQPGDWQRVVSLSREKKVVALGETGLDRYWKDVPFPLQQEYFDRHIRLSQQSHLPFIVHMRDCDEDILLMLREARQRAPLLGVMHSFTGTQQTLEECLGLGMYISFAGMVTYKKSDQLRQLVKLVPAEKILVETDAPYLSPHPFRSQRPNEPALIVNTAACVANERGMSVEAFAQLTSENASRLFRFS